MAGLHVKVHAPLLILHSLIQFILMHTLDVKVVPSLVELQPLQVHFFRALSSQQHT